MKKHILPLMLVGLFTAGFATAQMSILIVDDSDDGFNHISDFENVVTDLGYAFTSYDAQGTGTVPPVSTLQGYDLVIWHTGADSDSLALWNFNDTDNTDLETYLDIGGKLWLIGTDALYDRYGGAPVSFSQGDFVYDKLGVASYDVQTYVDDGALGLPLAEPAPGSAISNLPPLSWIFPTLWYVDGVTPVAGVATPVYNMGDSLYTFAGRHCALWSQNLNSDVLSMFFNVSQISDSVTMSDMTQKVLGHFQQLVVGTDPIEPERHLLAFPNPTRGSFSLQLPAETTGSLQVELFSLDGKKVFSQAFSGQTDRWEIRDPQLNPGMYFLKVQTTGTVYHTSIFFR